MKKSVKRSEGGFALFVVTLTVAIISIVGLSFLDVIRLDLMMTANERDVIRAQAIAEGGLIELINDTALSLPQPSGSLEVAQSAVQGSEFAVAAPGGDDTYSAKVRLLRIGPAVNSSQGKAQVVIHEIEVNALTGDNATNQVAAQVFTLTTFDSGRVVPRKHAR